MLRRNPTALTLTTEDIAIYEDKRVREAAALAEAQARAATNTSSNNPTSHASLKTQHMATPLNDRLQNRGAAGPGNAAEEELKGGAAAAQARMARTREERLGMAAGSAGGR